MREKITIDEGGPAFARAGDVVSGSNGSTGMSIRDYFAAKVLQGQIAFEGADGCDPEHIAGCAYQIADAMVKARGGRDD